MSYSRSFSGAREERDNIIPRFFMEAIIDPVRSEREGFSCYMNEERVQFMIPGNLNTSPVFVVSQEHKDRWPEQYKAFKSGNELSSDGTPLEMWPVVSKPMVLTLKAMGINTVEHVAGLSDTAVQQIKMGGYKLRELAKAYLDDAEAQALANKLSAENAKQAEKIALLERQNEEMSSMLHQLHAQMTELQNRPHPLATYIAPENQVIQPLPEVEGENPFASLPDLPMKRGPGRPRKEVN